MAADDKHAEKAREFAALVLEGLPRFEAAGPSDCDDAKTIYFVRHGEATHNVAPRPWGPELIDAPLTDVGRAQAETLQAITRRVEQDIEVVIVSPLTRAIQTALIGFSTLAERGDFPFIAMEECRRRFGKNLPDKRRCRSALATEFDRVDFTGIGEADELFLDDERESAEACLAARTRSSPCSTHALKKASPWFATRASSAPSRMPRYEQQPPELGAWFANAEMRQVRLRKVS